MVVTTGTFYLKPEHEEDFIRATTENHSNSINEDGNRCFDFSQSKDDSTVFFLYECFESAEHAAAHRETPHFLKWRDAVVDWMAKPREVRHFQLLCPKPSGGAE